MTLLSLSLTVCGIRTGYVHFSPPACPGHITLRNVGMGMHGTVPGGSRYRYIYRSGRSFLSSLAHCSRLKPQRLPEHTFTDCQGLLLLSPQLIGFFPRSFCACTHFIAKLLEVQEPPCSQVSRAFILSLELNMQ